MNLIQAIEHTKWQILSMFVEFGFSPARVMSEFHQDGIYYLYRAGRNKPSVSVERLGEMPAPNRTAGKVGDQAQTRKFPHDVTSLTPREAADMVEMSRLLKRAREKRGRQLSERERIFIWDEPRRAACLGSDPVAGRCSMDDYLWAVYRHCKLRGITLGVDACRRILQTKLLIAPLFSRRISLSLAKSEQPCYLSIPDAPAAAGEAGRKARQAFDAVFARLREWIEMSGEAGLGRGHGAN